MYRVYLNDKIIYSPGDDEKQVLSPKLELAVNVSGSFSFRLTKLHPDYDGVQPMSSYVRVEEDGKPIFYGRVLSVEKDFYGTKEVRCEGELAYFLDSIQEPYRYQNYSLRGFLSSIISRHNAKVDIAKRFTLGQVTVIDPNDSIYRYTNWETTLDVLMEKLVKRLGGYLRIRHVGSMRYLDYLESFDNTNTQEIVFGENLLDYTDNLDAGDIATRIIPLGARLETSSIEGLEEYTTIKSVNGGLSYIESGEAVKSYGIITKTVSFDNVTEPQNLLAKGRKYLEDVQFADIGITLKAIDLHLMNPAIESVKIGDDIRVISKVHGLNRIFPVTSLSLSLDKPQDSTFVLGTKEKGGLSERSMTQSQAFTEKVDSLPKQSETLKLARDNATALINAQTTGHVVTRSEEILIMDTADRNTARKVWRWNMNGLGYSKYGYSGPYSLAMTIDGSIVADFITTGTLNADLIKAGTLKDKSGNIEWNLATGSLTAKRLSIDSTNFKLTTYGSLTANNATLNGTLTTESGSNKVRLGGGNMSIFYNGKDLGLIGGNGFSGSDTIAGLNFDLEETGDYMTWAVQPKGGGNYNMVWTYARSGFAGFSEGKLNAGCDVDMRNYKLLNVQWPDGGVSGTMNFVKVNSMAGDGTASNWSNGCYLKFKNGILIEAGF